MALFKKIMCIKVYKVQTKTGFNISFTNDEDFLITTLKKNKTTTQR